MNFIKHITVAVIFIVVALCFHSPVVKAQEEDATFTFDATMEAQEIPNTLTSETNNLADVESITTEIDVWREDLGSSTTDGSYVGALFEPSILEVDYNPLSTNEWYSFETRIGYAIPYQEFPPATTSPIYDTSHEIIDYDATFPYPKSRSFVSLTQIANFSNRVIMSGATEFWIKIPALANCFNFDEMTPSIAIFKTDEDNHTIQSNLENGELWYEPSFSLFYQMYPYKWQVDEDGVPYDEEVTAGTIRGDFTSREGLLPKYKGNLPDIFQPIVPEHIVGDNIYSHIYATIEPNTNYIVSFTGILQSSPQIYLTEEDIHSNDRYSVIKLGDIEFDEPSEYGVGDPLDAYEFTAWHRWATLLKVDAINQPTINETISLPLDLAFSYIFKAGRGEEGMFGQELHFDEDDSIVFYNRMDSPTNDQYISIMLPFICDRDIEVELTVSLFSPNIKYEPQGVLSHTSETFVYADPYIWQSPTSMTYADYILFTVPNKINAETNSEPFVDVKVMITFMRSTDITFMFSTLANTNAGWEIDQVIEPNPNLIDMYIGSPYPYYPYVPFFHPRYDLTYLYQDVNDTQMALFTHTTQNGYETHTNGFDEYYVLDYKTPLDLNDHTVLHYDLFRSIQFTDGIWSEYAVDSEGVGYSTHFFERRVAIGKLEIWVDTSNNETNHADSWYDGALGYYEQAFELLSEGKILESFASSVAGTIALLYDGGEALWGSITGAFSKAWEWIKEVGSFIKTILSEFIGTILSVFGDIEAGLESIIEVLLYVVAIILFLWLLSWAGKLLYIGRFDV